MTRAILPTVGRNLWFWPAPGDMEITQHPPKDGEEGKQPLHAHILYVHDDKHVTLEVVDHIGNRHARGDVLLYQAGETPDMGGEFCFWMPYQQGQARADEAKVGSGVSGSTESLTSTASGGTGANSAASGSATAQGIGLPEGGSAAGAGSSQPNPTASTAASSPATSTPARWIC